MEGRIVVVQNAYKDFVLPIRNTPKICKHTQHFVVFKNQNKHVTYLQNVQQC